MSQTQIDIDHVLVCLSGPSAATKALVDFGLTPGRSGSQPGTGAAHTVFWFDNAYLELAWCETNKAAFDDAPDLRFMERTNWKTSGWCPFGLSFRYRSPALPLPPRLPIATWDYAAPFLPKGAVPIPVGANSDRRREPLIIVSLVSGRPDAKAKCRLLQDDLGLSEITSLKLGIVGSEPLSPELSSMATILPITFDRTSRPQLGG